MRAPRTNHARRRDFVGLPLGIQTGVKRFAPNSGIWKKLTRSAKGRFGGSRRRNRRQGEPPSFTRSPRKVLCSAVAGVAPGRTVPPRSAYNRGGRETGGAHRRRGRCCPVRGFVGVVGSRYRVYTREAPAVSGVCSFRRLVFIVDASGRVAAGLESLSGAQKAGELKSGYLGIPTHPARFVRRNRGRSEFREHVGSG